MENKNLLFTNMTLHARIRIRDFFLNNTVREIYENIGQVLSLVKLQLAPGFNAEVYTVGENKSPQHLLGQSIRDLRLMSKSFYPDADILTDNGIAEAVANIVNILYPNTGFPIKIKGIEKDMEPGLKLIAFDMIKEILIKIKKTGSILIYLTISCSKTNLSFIVSYFGTELSFDEAMVGDGNEVDTTLQQRVQLINGRFKMIKTKTDAIHLKLILPLKVYFYE